MASREIDLHGRTWAEAVEVFIDFYNNALRSPGGSGVRLTVVHGYGSSGVGGVLRTRFRAFLQRHEGRLEFTPGERADGNPGQTIVTPRKPLPVTEELLAEQVWEYCERPKTISKITGKFRRHGQPRVAEAVRLLEGQRRLRAEVRGKARVYQAV